MPIGAARYPVNTYSGSCPRRCRRARIRYKYRLYFGAGGVSRVRYDNERGKGDHRHVGEREAAYAFTSLDSLLADSRRDVENWS